METIIYLDYNATTPIDPRVAEVLMPLLGPVYGNPSSSHTPGREAREVVERARGEVAGLLGCSPAEVIFTGGNPLNRPASLEFYARDNVENFH